MHRYRRGFTFVEIMVAVVVLVAGFLPIFNMMQAGTKRARFQKIRAFGLSLAQSNLERVRGCSLKYLDAEGPEAEAAAALGLPNMWNGPGDINELVGQDPLLNPTPGVEGVPEDDEMKVLIEKWTARSKIFHPIMGKTSPKWNDRLAKLKMRIVTSSVTWSKQWEDFRVPNTWEEFRDGKNGRRYQGREVVSLVAVSGEGLFHPPPDLGVTN